MSAPLITYTVGCLALIAKPGPDLMCTLATALSEGRRRAIMLMTGLIAGCWLWVVLLTVGAATFFTGHPKVLTAIRVVGMALHGDETPERLTETLQRIYESGCGSVTPESRPHSDWLGEGWYRDLGLSIGFARQHGMSLFIFDDYWWPSQMMGGRVPEQYGSKLLVADVAVPENRNGQWTVSRAGLPTEQVIGIVAAKLANGNAYDAASLKEIPAAGGDITLPGQEWRALVFRWEFCGKKGSQCKYISVDGADREATQWFLAPNAARLPRHPGGAGPDAGRTVEDPVCRRRRTQRLPDRLREGVRPVFD